MDIDGSVEMVHEATASPSAGGLMTNSQPGAPSAGAFPGSLGDDLGDPGARILVVDDDESVREFAVSLVSSFGYAVASADCSTAAMRLVAEIPSLDLVFTDIVMPGLSGIVLADMVKKRRPELKILYTSGYRDIARAESEAGVLHGKILEKPYRPAELEVEIQQLLS